MIEFKNISKRFPNILAIDDLNLTINNGEIFGLLGPNGAGKSTTLKILTGILSPTNGDVLIDGHSIIKDTYQAKKSFGFVPDNPDMFLGMTGINYLAFIGSLFNVDKDTILARAKKYGEMFEIYNSLNDYIANYSHGMRQKIILMGSLIHEPQNWILDEPLTGLDPEAIFEMKTLMQTYAKKNRLVLFSTHVLDVAEKICDRIGIINKGQLIFVGSLEELRNKRKEQGSLEDLFLELTQK